MGTKSFASKLELIRKELDDQAPIKTKILQGNISPFMKRELRKAIMERTLLKNFYYKNKTENAKRSYKLQRNRCVKLLSVTKKQFFNDLSEKQLNLFSAIKAKKKRELFFWKTMRSLKTMPR